MGGNDTFSALISLGVILVFVIISASIWLVQGGLAHDKRKSVERAADVIDNAEAGEAAELFQTGTMYLEGSDSVSADRAEAIAYYRKAAELGSTDAQIALRELGEEWKVHADELFELGKNLAEGANGEQKNPEEAIRVLEKAARHGSGDASHFLATAYYRGIGAKKDMSKATYWYRKGAEQGSEKSRSALQMLKELGM
jgi:TPR repeat protein